MTLLAWPLARPRLQMASKATESRRGLSLIWLRRMLIFVSTRFLSLRFGASWTWAAESTEERRKSGRGCLHRNLSETTGHGKYLAGLMAAPRGSLRLNSGRVSKWKECCFEKIERGQPLVCFSQAFFHLRWYLPISFLFYLYSFRFQIVVGEVSSYVSRLRRYNFEQSASHKYRSLYDYHFWLICLEIACFSRFELADVGLLLCYVGLLALGIQTHSS